MNKVHELAESIGKKLAQAEKLGAEGNVEDSMKTLEEVEEFRKQKALAEVIFFFSIFVVFDLLCRVINLLLNIFFKFQDAEKFNYFAYVEFGQYALLSRLDIRIIQFNLPFWQIFFFCNYLPNFYYPPFCPVCPLLKTRDK